MGTDKESFVELTERIGRKTGGVSVYPFTSAKRGSPDPVAYVIVRGKAMGGKAGDLVEIMRDLLTRARLDDKVSRRRRAAGGRAGGGRLLVFRLWSLCFSGRRAALPR